MTNENQSMKCLMYRNDTEKALKAFEHCVSSFSKTPMLFELLVQLIRKGDVSNEERVIELASQVHDEKYSLHYQAFAYLTCGLVNSARLLFKVCYYPFWIQIWTISCFLKLISIFLQTPGLRAYPALMESHCIYCVQEDREDELEHLISITKELFGVDRHRFYHHLLTIYINKNNGNRVLDMCTRMDQEGVQPRKELLFRLAPFLERSSNPSKENQIEWSLVHLVTT